MKTWNDVWQYLCNHCNARELLRYYSSEQTVETLSFWHGVLLILECEGKVASADAINIWKEIEKGE